MYTKSRSLTHSKKSKRIGYFAFRHQKVDAFSSTHSPHIHCTPHAAYPPCLIAKTGRPRGGRTADLFLVLCLSSLLSLLSLFFLSPREKNEERRREGEKERERENEREKEKEINDLFGFLAVEPWDPLREKSREKEKREKKGKEVF